MSSGVAGNACSMVTRSSCSVPAYVTLLVELLRASTRRVPAAFTSNTTSAAGSIQGPSNNSWRTPAGRAARRRVAAAAAGVTAAPLAAPPSAASMVLLMVVTGGALWVVGDGAQPGTQRSVCSHKLGDNRCLVMRFRSLAQKWRVGARLLWVRKAVVVEPESAGIGVDSAASARARSNAT